MFGKSDLLTFELLYIVGIYFVSIDAGAHVAIILLACGRCEVIMNCLGQVLYLGRAPRTKETLLNFCEWCRVTQHSRVFRGLTGCQRTPRFWGVTEITSNKIKIPLLERRELLKRIAKIDGKKNVKLDGFILDLYK